MIKLAACRWCKDVGDPAEDDPWPHVPVWGPHTGHETGGMGTRPHTHLTGRGHLQVLKACKAQRNTHATWYGCKYYFIQFNLYWETTLKFQSLNTGAFLIKPIHLLICQNSWLFNKLLFQCKFPRKCFKAGATWWLLLKNMVSWKSFTLHQDY